jgi:signal transduction histidine kinase
MGLKNKADMNEIERLQVSLRLIYMLTILVSLIVAGTVLYGFYKGSEMNNLYVPLIDASMEIKIESTNAHLWLEEIVSGDLDEELDQVWRHLDKADWYAQAMLTGGANEHGIYLPLKNNIMRGHIERVRDQLTIFRDVAKQRYQRRIIAGPGTDIDQYYDTIFNELISNVDYVEHELKEIMETDKKEFWYNELFLVGFFALLLVCMGFIYWRFNRQRLGYISYLYHAKSKLDKEVIEHKEAEKKIEVQHEQLQKTLFEIAELRDSEEERLIDLNLSNEQLRIAIDEAETSNRAIRKLFSNMISEARVPTIAIIEYINMTLDSGLTEKHRNNIDSIKKFAYSNLSLFDSYIDVLKIESGNIDLNIMDLNIMHTLENIVMILTPKANEKGLTLNYNVDPEVPLHLVGDKVRLSQILMQLVGNAIKFTDKGNVTVSVQCSNCGTDRQDERNSRDSNTRVLHISVSDTGVGISNDKLISLFDAPSIFNTPDSNEYGEMHIGLNISDKLVHIMGGEIWAESEEGKGSTFHFTVVLDVVSEVPVDDISYEDISESEQFTNTHINDSDTDSPADVTG